MESELQNSLERLADDWLPVTLVFRAGEVPHEEYLRLPVSQRRKRYTRSSVTGKGCLVYLGETVLGAADVDEDGRTVRLREEPAKAAGRAGGAQIRVVVSAGRAWSAPEELLLRPGDRVVLDRTADEPLDVFMPGSGSVWMKGEALTVDDCFGVRLQSCAPEARSHARAPNRVEVEVFLGEGVFPLSDVAGAGDGTICPLETNCLEPMTLTCGGVPLARGYLEVMDDPSPSQEGSPTGRLSFVVTHPLSGSPAGSEDGALSLEKPADAQRPSTPTGQRLDVDAVLDHYPMHRLLVVLQNEPPQTAAWVVKRVAERDPSKAQQLFNAIRDRVDPSFVPLFALCRPLPTERSICHAVAESMVSMLSPDERRDLMDGIEAFSGAATPEPDLVPDTHLRATADVLTVLPEREARDILERIEEVDPEAAAKIEGFILFIADIARLSDRNIQKLLRELDMQDLVLVLADAEEALRSAVLRNMSTRAARMLEEERGFVKEPNPAGVDEAKTRVLRVFSTLLENGDITL